MGDGGGVAMGGEMFAVECRVEEVPGLRVLEVPRGKSFTWRVLLFQEKVKRFNFTDVLIIFYLIFQICGVLNLL